MPVESKDAKRSFKAGDVIMKQGEQGSCAYIIEDGQVEILIEKPDGKIQLLSTRGSGTIIGEMAIVDAAPRVATVKALKDCKVLEITRDDFALRLKSTDPVIQMISQVILTRYRDTLTRAEILGANLFSPPPEALEKDFMVLTDVVESIKIANEFKEALEKRQLSLHYQPIVDLAKGGVLGFEALMRWMHPEKGSIPPSVFIPIVEKSGLIVEASKWALDEACAALKRIENSTGPGGASLYMSVNFSSLDFAERDFVTGVINTIKNRDITPSQIKLEITERLLIQQPDNAKETLEACRRHGIEIATDDFGTGYSSLSYLYHFPVDVLKIDQSFVRAMHRGERSLGLVKSIVGLGKNLNLTCIAEGVESREEAQLLSDLGCNAAQGYYFAKPMAEPDLIKMLTGWKAARVIPQKSPCAGSL